MEKMKKQVLLLLVMACTAVAAIAQEVKHIEVNVGDFTTLSVENNINVVYCADDKKAGMAEFDAPQSVADMFIFKNNKKGKLSIQLTDYNFKEGVPTVVVYSKMLQMVVNQSDSTITIKNNLVMPKFTAKTSYNGVVNIRGLKATTAVLEVATGKGRINADGEVENLRCKFAGTGQIRALELKAKDIDCSMGGSGHIYCNSTGGKLHLKGVGSGKVHYIGTPSEIKVKQLGTLKALPFDGTFAP
ncbi:MAG: DUF2807 domain-containing protein [Muribaculaceae bacterium]|nr:DUF2807 domain-containing protein [Muribaculaceae bacterium]